ncbi:MAG: GspH/FimT family pseudopilin [Nitrospirota bacterium]|mgnify:CR=1 FL=1
MTNLTNKKGVTLTELMVVLAIVMITAAIAIPAYVSDLPRQRAKAAAQGMHADLRLARSRAVANNTPYLVCFTSTSYQLVSAANCQAAGVTTIDKTVDFEKDYKGVRFGVGGSTGACKETTSHEPIYFPGGSMARFDIRGSSVDGNGTFYPGGVVYLTNTLDPNQSAYCVQVEGTTGRAKLYRWNAKSSPPAWE